MYTIDFDKIEKALPKHATFEFIKYKGKSLAIEVECWPSMDENENEKVFQAFREIIGSENISEFYTEETGGHFYCFVKNKPFQMRRWGNSVLMTEQMMSVGK